jgi:hypothetical protein
MTAQHVQGEQQQGKGKRKVAAAGAAEESVDGCAGGNKGGGRGKAAKKGEGASPSTGAKAGRAARHNSKSVDVICGGLLGVFDYRYFPACKVRLQNGKEVSLSQFEVLAAQGTGSTWKSTVRVVEKGKMVEAIRVWLGDRGLDGARG